ncbi:hypothetical protein CANARDRAFT_200937 [[Candida] arabinofermentans NRRL YB-2248]|uniref:LicD/FKTN/FKRP nucleotidyltransferase domain-containing protein n=1 Tax=[Candida] arabinofermentans NRRL YB-2248 TaxID=983967 RepID=A0A1E4SYB9_9ASCO|nr:hypothetical protein CANARDRAFT_200937 [[Candida] arabinofermentans NRRL YB-2248]
MLEKLKPRSYHSRLIPRKKRCILLLALICAIQTIFFTFYQTNKDFDVLSDITSYLKFSLSSTPSDLIEKIENKLINVDLSSDYNRYWKFYTDLNSYKLKFNPMTYLTQREKKHFFDPRITYSVYLNHIRKQFELNNPSNLDTNDDLRIKVPFSWQDWVDLSVLNPYLEYKEEDKPTCKDILTQGLDYTVTSKSEKSSGKFVDKSCVDNKDYKGNTPKTLLPGFNFIERSDKKTFLEKKIHAKSYLLSSAPIPNSILFLSTNGTYEVFPDQDQTMIDSGIFNEYLNDYSTSDSNIADPVDEFNKLVDNIPARKADVDFNELLNYENDYKYDIPLESFTYDYESIIKNYESKSKSKSLRLKEKKHLDSLKYSKSLNSKKLPKSFKEVNINWPASYNGHRLTENGGHYDYRFFNGFLTESQINDFDEVNEKRKIILHRMLHTWLQFTYKQGIVSLIAHGSLLSWYWDGLVFEWDNDIDVQMPIMELDKFSMKFNNSLIVEDLNYGFHKYYIDCGSFITHRTKGNGQNNIDARFIDADSGMYIDITGLALTDTAKLPSRFERKWKQINSSDKDNNKDTEIKDENDEEFSDDPPVLPGKRKKKLNTATETVPQLSPKAALARNTELQVFNCRNNHFYSYEELSPVSLSMMEGAPCLIPNDYSSVLNSEYVKGLTRDLFNKHKYLNDLRFWVPIKQIQKAVKIVNNGKSLRMSKLMSFYEDHGLEILLKLFEDDEILKEFYLTHQITNNHALEFELIRKLKENDYNDNEIEFEVDKAQYIELMESYKHMEKPLRKDLFNYLNEIEKLGNFIQLELENDQASILDNGEGFYYSNAIKKPTDGNPRNRKKKKKIDNVNTQPTKAGS